MVAIATRWQTLEGTIEREMGSFIAVGRALQTIRDSKLYREQFRSFNEYCNVRWGMGRNYAQKMMTGSIPLLQLPPAQLRPQLLALPAPDGHGHLDQLPFLKIILCGMAGSRLPAAGNSEKP